MGEPNRGLAYLSLLVVGRCEIVRAVFRDAEAAQDCLAPLFGSLALNHDPGAVGSFELDELAVRGLDQRYHGS